MIAAAPSGASTDSAARAHQLAIQGLAAQERKDLAAAKLLYEQALALAPDHADALHMLGVVHFDLGDAATAVSLIMRALDLTQWQIPTVRQNFGLALAKLASAGRNSCLGFPCNQNFSRYDLASAVGDLATCSARPTFTVSSKC